MNSQPTSRRAAGVLLVIWLILMALTIGSFWFADVGGAGRAATAAFVLGIAALKGHLVAGVFMEMIHAPRAWAIVMSAFLVAQAALIIALFS